MAEPNTKTNTEPTGNDDTAQQEKTFTQSEVDALIQNRIARERKKYPSDDELINYKNWKASQQTEQEKLNEAQSQVSTLQAQLEESKRSNYLLQKGLSGDEAEFIAFKAGKLVDDKTTFEQAVDSLIKPKETKKVKLDFSGQVGGQGNAKETQNAQMNALIRGAFK